MEDKLELQGIYSKGYGIIAKQVMQDNDISIQAKGIYAYLCSFCGGGTVCFPGRQKICSDLNINKDTFTKYLKQLTNKNYVTVKQLKSDKVNKFCHNIYSINLVNIPEIETPCPNLSDTETSDPTISDTNNNNINNKEEEERNLKEELKNTIEFYENNITLITPFVAEDIEKYLKSGLEAELIIEAMKEAVSRNKRNWTYVTGILNNCIDNKISTKKQFKISQEEFKSNKNQINKKQKTEEKIEYKEIQITEEEFEKKMEEKGKKYD